MKILPVRSGGDQALAPGRVIFGFSPRYIKNNILSNCICNIFEYDINFITKK